MPALFESLAFPETKGSIAARRREIVPFINQAYAAGLSPSELFDALGGTTVNLPSADFYDLANRTYAKLDKATAIQSLAPTDEFLIGDLPQQKAAIPDRFYAVYTVDYQTPEGIETTKTRLYGFGEKLSKEDIEADILGQLQEHYGVKENQVSSVNILELYKQY